MPTICKQTLDGVLREPAAAFVSGLPLFNKPLKMRLDLLDQAFELMQPDAPFVQFTYNAISPIPRSHGRVRAEASGPRVEKHPARPGVGVPDQPALISHAAGCMIRCAMCTVKAGRMSAPKILVIPGSLRSASYNIRLAAVATKELTLAEADVTRISLADYPLPIYDADLVAKSGPPANAVKLKQMLAAHRGVFIASPEYNASITPLLKNTIDWISVVREPGEVQLAVFQNRAFALGGASPGRSGALNSLLTLRQVLAIGCRALGGAGAGRDPERRTGVQRPGRARSMPAPPASSRRVLKKLVDYARMFGG